MIKIKTDINFSKAVRDIVDETSNNYMPKHSTGSFKFDISRVCPVVKPKSNVHDGSMYITKGPLALEFFYEGERITKSFMIDSKINRPQFIYDVLSYQIDNLGYILEDINHYLLRNGVDVDVNEETGRYVLSNNECYKNMFGACVLFYPGVMQKVSKLIGGNFFVLPSSIHELVLVKDNNGVCADELRETVTDINSRIVDPEIQISNDVYYYDSESNELLIA